MNWKICPPRPLALHMAPGNFSFSLSCPLQPSHLHRTCIWGYFLFFCLTKDHFSLIFLKDKSLLIEELKQALPITLTSSLQQLSTGCSAAHWIASLLLPQRANPKQSHILVSPHSMAISDVPCTGQDTKCHQLYPATRSTLCHRPGQSPQCEMPPSDIWQVDTQQEASLALQSHSPFSAHSEDQSSSSKKTAGGAPQQKSLPPFPSTVSRENRCFRLGLHFCVINC